MASNTTLIHKLQQALNTKGYKILYSTSQFYSDYEDRPVTVYHIKKAVYDEEKGKNVVIELYKSASQIRIVLFLRDLWYEANSWALPTDNKVWNQYKDKKMKYVEQ